MKLQEYFLCTKKTKITTLFNKSLRRQTSTHVHDTTTTHVIAFFCLQTSLSASRFNVRTPAPVSAASHACVVVVSWWASKTGTEEKKLLNKVDIFVFFVHKKYSHSFIQLRLNHWCHMDYFNDVLTTFLGPEHVSCIAVYAGSESSRFNQKYLNFRSYRFGTTWGWVINDRIFIFGLNTPFKISRFNFMHYLTLFVIICEIYQQFLWETCFKVNPTPIFFFSVCLLNI